MVTKPKVKTQATSLRSIRSLFMTVKSGGMSSGMNAMCTGTRFWLMIDIARIPPSIVYFMTVSTRSRDAFSAPIREMSASERSLGSPELATAIAKAPRRA